MRYPLSETTAIAKVTFSSVWHGQKNPYSFYQNFGNTISFRKFTGHEYYDYLLSFPCPIDIFLSH